LFAQSINVSLTSNVSGTAFSWIATPSSPNISGYLNGTGNTISQTLTNSGYTIETVTYAITPSANGCTGAPVNYIVTVNPVPDLSNNPKSQHQCNIQSTNLPYFECHRHIVHMDMHTQFCKCFRVLQFHQSRHPHQSDID